MDRIAHPDAARNGVDHAVAGGEPVLALTPVQAGGDTLWYLLRRSWIIVLFAAVAAAVGGYVSSGLAERYESTATVLVNQGGSATELIDPGSTRPSSDPERDINTQVELITLPPVAEAVRGDVGLQDSVDDLLDDVSTTVRGTSDLIEITANRMSPREARDVAQSFATQYVERAGRERTAAFAGAIERTREQLARMPRTRSAKPDRLVLRRELRELETAAALATPTTSVASDAQLPTAAVSPRPLRDAVLVAFAAAILCAVALLALRAIGQARRLAA
jgi:capsular polysaccharide biosynthesis protein